MQAPAGTGASPASVPALTLGALFLRFLRFGALAFGGPVAQIAMLKRELVDEERWIAPERFGRVLAVYQALPGPEAHELCVYFGMLARGRLGGLLAGLGFMLPGLALMLALAFAYTRIGSWSPGVAAVFAGLQAAVVALIVRSTHRIAQHALASRMLLAIAVCSTVGSLLGVHFGVTLAAAGAFHWAWRAGRKLAAGVVAVLWAAAAIWTVATATAAALVVQPETAAAAPHVGELFVSGLRAGLLTFGGAYTAIPFLESDAAGPGGWMTRAQFLDGIALAGVLPAPLVIFGTFVGWIGGGLVGALALTAGIFAPAFAFTLVAHDPLERLVRQPRVRELLDGVTAGVVGLIAATAIALAPAAAGTVPRAAIAVLALAAFYLVRSRLAVLYVMSGAAAAGWLLC